MFHGIESILIGSEDPETLAKFYREVVGLKQTVEFAMGDNGKKGFGFDMERGASLYINHHTEVKGKNHGPQRIIFNIEVDTIESAFDQVKAKGAKVIAETYHVENYGMIATFADPDGNYFQLVQVREPAN